MLRSIKQGRSLNTHHRFEACNTEFPISHAQVLCAARATSPQIRELNRFHLRWFCWYSPIP